MKTVLIVLSMLVTLSLHAEETTEYDLKINVKRFFLLINGVSYSDASGVKVVLPKKTEPVVQICADGDALHSQVLEVMDALKSLGVTKMHFATSDGDDCK